MPHQKIRYRQCCEQEQLPLQMQPWWLDAVCGEDSWNVVLTEDQQGKIAGALPYYHIRRFGLPMITMPPFTAYAGPWIKFPEEEMKLTRASSCEKQILADLAGQLPRVAFYSQNFLTGFQNWLPFYWLGYRQTTRYTYVIDELRNPEMIFDHFKQTLRTDIRKAEKLVTVTYDGDLEAFYKLNRLSYERQGRKIPYSIRTIKRLDIALSERGQRNIYFARDQVSGQSHATLYLAWDAHTAYCLLSGVDARFKQSAAPHLLYWQAIKDSAARGLQRFDFEGSMIEPIEHVLRAFGATQLPYFRIFKTRNRLLAALAALRGKI